MKKTIKYIPLTALAAAIALGGSLSANETVHKFNRTLDEENQQPGKAHPRPMKASELLGMNIDTNASEKIGEIDEIIIHADTGEILALVVSTGGFLGMGQQQSLLSPKDLRFNGERTLMQTDLSKDQLKMSPNYDKGDTSGFDRVRPLGKTAADLERRSERMNNGLEERQRAAYIKLTGKDRAGARAERAEDRAERANPSEVARAQHRKFAVSELVGMSVENRQGETIGDVDEVFLDLEKGEVVGVVVSTGGFLGMGDRKTLFGMRELSLDAKHEKIILDYNREQIRIFPEFKPDEKSDFNDLNERMERLGPRTGMNNSGGDDRDVERKIKHTSEMTVFDQGNSSEEIKLTAAIRTAIRKDDNLSGHANNVTIITSKDKVLLRGEVDSAAEKTAVEGIAHSKAGRENVTSELTVQAR